MRWDQYALIEWEQTNWHQGGHCQDKRWHFVIKSNCSKWHLIGHNFIVSSQLGQIPDTSSSNCGPTDLETVFVFEMLWHSWHGSWHWDVITLNPWHVTCDNCVPQLSHVIITITAMTPSPHPALLIIISNTNIIIQNIIVSSGPLFPVTLLHCHKSCPPLLVMSVYSELTATWETLLYSKD